MDIYCRHCREPWSNDCLHEEVDERRLQGVTSTYEEVAREFRRFGCGALYAFTGHSHEPVECSESRSSDDEWSRAVIDAAYEVCGNDMDGAAALMADYL